MGMVGNFIVELKDLVNQEEMSDVAKDYFLRTIKEFQHNWEGRVGPDYQAILKQKDEQLEVLQQQIERFEHTTNELRFEKEEIVKHYEGQLELKSKAIDRIIDSNSGLSKRVQLAEELNFNLMETFLDYKKRKESDY
jgi:hypothetical protein